MSLNIYLFSASQTRTDILDGGSRIMIECAKRWQRDGHVFHIVTCKEGFELYQRYGLGTSNFTVVTSPQPRILGIYLLYLLRILKLSFLAIFRLSVDGSYPVIISGSDFLPDLIPALILRMRFPKAKWIVAFYLLAPRPLSRESPYKGRLILRGIMYYATQSVGVWLAKRYGDMVWLANEFDRRRFMNNKQLDLRHVIVVRWGVNSPTSLPIPDSNEKVFDAVYVGRLHPQKGLIELLEIWGHVLTKRPEAKLAVIGSGELEVKLKERIQELKLQRNVILFGFKDGEEKSRILKSSRIFVHPATYDTGAIAPIESMAYGLPGICFDLPALRSYYPKGMIRITPGDAQMFASAILRLLENPMLFSQLREEAIQLSKESSWSARSHELLQIVQAVAMSDKAYRYQK